MAQILYVFSCLIIVLYFGNYVLSYTIQSTVYTNSTFGNISDGVDTLYKPNQRYVWIIANPNPIDFPFISLHFSETKTECLFDYIIVFAVNDQESTKMLATLSGNFDSGSLPQINVRSSRILIYFISDTDYVLSGFQANFHVFPCLNNCSGNGICERNKCDCFPGWRGNDCSKPACSSLCTTQQQNCVSERSKHCTCTNGFIGIRCQMSADGLKLASTWAMVFNYSEHNQFLSKRAGHAGCYVSPYLYIFGGFDLNAVFNDLLLYDFSENDWIVAHNFHQPSPRYFLTMNHVKENDSNYLLLFGGNLGNGRFSNEFWFYNIEKHSWKMPNNSLLVMTPTQLHAAAVVNLKNDKFLYVYGGQKISDTNLYISSDIFRNNLRTFTWEHVVANPGNVTQLFLQRAGHSMVYDQVSNALVVFGGFHSDGTNKTVKRSHHVLLFDLKTHLWAEVTSTNAPKPLAFHSASIIGDYMVIIGGNAHKHNSDESCHSNLMFFYNLRCNNWHNPPVSRSYPGGRFAHVAAVANDTLIFVHGGYNGMISNELYVYKAPIFAIKNISYVCTKHDSKEECLLDQRCSSTEGYCSPRPFTIGKPPTCLGYCKRLHTCQSCTVFNSYQLGDGDIWKTIPCQWCTKRGSCFQYNDTESLTKCEEFDWWGGANTQIDNTFSRCIDSNIPAGFSIAYYYNDKFFNSPDRIEFRNGELNILVLNTGLIGNHTIIVDGFLHVYSSTSNIDISLQTEDGYGQFFLSNTSNPSGAWKPVVENPGNLSRDDKDPFYSLPGSNEKRKLYYCIRMYYYQMYKTGINRKLKLSWTWKYRNHKYLRGRYATIEPSFLEPYRSPVSENHCADQRDCMNCLLDYSCVWCSVNNSCLLKTRLTQPGSPPCNQAYVGSQSTGDQLLTGLIMYPAACITCASISICSRCNENRLCIWTVPGGCQKRIAVPRGTRAFGRGRCPVPCNARATCHDCLRHNGADKCTWCSNKRRCFDFKFYRLFNMFGECAEWFQDRDQCHECGSSKTCQDCVKSLNCGWCRFGSNLLTGSCVRGDLAGPEDVGVCRGNVTTSFDSYSWSYGYCDMDECTVERPAGIPLHNCSTHAACINTPTSYQCVCDQGYSGDGYVCERTCYKECMHGTCSEYPTYECECALGWTGNDALSVDCNVDCRCNFHSTCKVAVGLCDSCEHNTTGRGCELCIAEHFGNPLSRKGCKPCFCNGHGDRERGLCDPSSGSCYCLNKTTGRYCDECLPGYYGNPRNGGVCYRMCNGRYYSDSLAGSFGIWNVLESYIHCLFVIVKPQHTISLTIGKNMFIDCTLNKLLVYGNKSLTPDSIIASLCGRFLDEDILIHSKTGVLIVSYQSNEIQHSVGFNATFETFSSSAFSHLSCPQNCSDFGQCVNGLCHCATNRVGLDCSQSADSISGAVAWKLNYDRFQYTNDNLNVSAAPSALFGHTMTSRFNELWLFGGFNYNGLSSDLWRYDVANERWSRILTKLSPPARYMHSSVLSPDSNSYYLYGGMDGDGNTLSDFWRFRFGNTDDITANWSVVVSNQNLPAVAAHTLTLCSNSTALLVGGYSLVNNFSAAVWAFNFETQQWKKLKSCESSFKGVYGHSAVFDHSSDFLYVYGGLLAPDARPNSKMLVYSLQHKRWSAVPPINTNLDPLFTPPLRYFHTATQYLADDHRGFIIVGGKASSDKFSNDVWLYRYDCRMWIQLDSRISLNSVLHQTVDFPPKLGAGAAITSQFNLSANSTLFYVYGGNSNGLLQTSLLTLHVTSPCKAATSSCACSRMFAGCTLCPSDYGSEDTLCLPRSVHPSQCALLLNRGSTGSRTLSCDSYCQSLSSFDFSCESGKRSDVTTCSDACSKFKDCDGCVEFLGGSEQRYCKWCRGQCIDERRKCTNSKESLSSSCPATCPFANMVTTENRNFSKWFRSVVQKYNALIQSQYPPAPPKPCPSFKDCRACLMFATCSWSVDLRECIDSTAYDLRCLNGLCGAIVRRSHHFCPLPCLAITYCRECLKQRSCGWSSVIGGNGDGVCQSGNLQGMHGSSSISTTRESVWNFLQCPPEDECRNNHHNCNSQHRTRCQDLKDGFACLCREGFELSGENETCLPVCTPACINGVCARPDECECEFGYYGDRCSYECSCHGHSNCYIRNGVESCTHCMNNTMGDRCQFCQDDFVGDPTRESPCVTCLEICNKKSLHCTDNSDSDHGPESRDATTCSDCSGNSEGQYCEICSDGYFLYKGECMACSCNGHDTACSKETGKCSCQNNTMSSSECDDKQGTSEYLSCLWEQCDQCKKGYIGDPHDGGHCYVRVEKGGSQCLHSTFHPGCSVPLSPGHTSLIALDPTFSNVDIRVFIDISEGEVDVFISHKNDEFQVVTSSNGTQFVTGPLSRRTIRSANRDSSDGHMTIHSANRDSFDDHVIIRKVRKEAGSISDQFVLMSPYKSLSVYGVRKRLVVVISHLDYPLNSTRFYVIFRASDSLPSDGATNKGGAAGRIIFRQDVTAIDLFVFFSVFFSIFFVMLSICIIIWKIKQAFDFRLARLAHHRKLETMASRPFSTVYIGFDKVLPIVSNSQQANQLSTSHSKNQAKKRGGCRSGETNSYGCDDANCSSSSSSLDLLPAPMLHTTGNLFALEQESDDLDDDPHHDRIIPTSFANRKATYSTPLSLQANSTQMMKLPRKTGSSPSSSKQSSSNFVVSSFSTPPDPMKSAFNPGPIAVEYTEDMNAAVSTLILQMPCGGHSSCSIVLGSALVSARFIGGAFQKSKRRKFFKAYL